ncbi:polysaccharide deacetylase family protein [Streptomyces sp. SolWspMP-sol7th]|uniref:polysaccharide deacetylase family protein n=1 Tax=Streptomyces sp. SolWspMP-sol7th TaxID=1839776 RepID=UPI0034A0B19C
MLAAQDVRATFFVCGRQAAKHPALLRRITEAGHLVGNHTWDHRRLTGLGRAAVEEQIARTSETVRRATGRAPAWFPRPLRRVGPHRVHARRPARHGTARLERRHGGLGAPRRRRHHPPRPRRGAPRGRRAVPRRRRRPRPDGHRAAALPAPPQGGRLGPGPPGPTTDAGRCEVGRGRRRASGRGASVGGAALRRGAPRGRAPLRFQAPQRVRRTP